jgi:HEAT repeat protein
MNVWLSGYMLALGGIFLLWLSVSTYVIVTRALFDIADLSFHTARRVLERRLARLGSAEAALTGLPRRTLAGIAADASTAPAVARVAARRLLDRRSERVIRDAGAHRNEAQKWRRIASLRILSIAGWPDATPLLRTALEDADPDVAGAAVSILGSAGTREHAELLVDALRRNVVARSRIAAQLDNFAIPILDMVKPLLDDLDPAVRQWGATLIARYDDPIVGLELAALVVDDDPQVRAAALKGMARGGSPLATPAAMTALDDPVWFVRVHAARALGRLGHPELATDVVALLGDPHWWVRAAAKDALEAMGSDATPAVIEALRNDDEFVRNSAAEVLQNTGVVDELVAHLADAPDDELAATAVQSVFEAGGPSLSEAAVQRSDPRVAARARELQAAAALQAS